MPFIVHDVLRSPGQPLDAEARAFMEPRFGHDFGNVRVHTDAKAAESAWAVDAHAYTVGPDIVFGARKYTPNNISGRLLLAHELAHVTQQSAARASLSGRIDSPTDSFETEAEETAKAVVTGQPIHLASPRKQIAIQRSALSDDIQLAWLKRPDEVFKLLRQLPVSTRLEARLDADLQQWMSIYLVSDDYWRAWKIIEEGPEDNWSIVDREELSLRSNIGLQASGETEQKKPPTQTSGAPVKKAGDPVDDDVPKMKAHLAKDNVEEGKPLAEPRGTTFVLHDTSGSSSTKALEQHVKQGHGLLGKGVAAWIPRDEGPIIARPDFYESQRPSTTEWEKATNVFEKPEDKRLKMGEAKQEVWMKRRDALLRQVWNATSKDVRDSAMEAALTGLSPQELGDEKKGDDEKYRKTRAKEFKAPIENQMKTGSREKIWTAGAWTVEEICNRQRVAEPPTEEQVAKSSTELKQEQDVKTGCASLLLFFAERKKRVSNIVSVEIIQPGVMRVEDKQSTENEKAKVENREPKKVSVSPNTCRPENLDIIPLKDPPYSDQQYRSVRTLYIRAALIAGKFPTVTTHYAVDAFIDGHCDPRCFNLTSLYRLIAETLGHAKESAYGIKPIYGIKADDADANVWWDKTKHNICKTSPPK